jgi:uncharacterized protein YndB with AHSA1/START domain
MDLIDINVARVIPVSAEKIFDVWIDPGRRGGPWFGAERATVNPVVDGLFYFAVEHEGKKWHHYGRFLRMEPPWLIQYTWMSEATKGLESIVTLTLEEQGNETNVTVNHSGLPDDELGRQHREGWTWVLSVLAESLAPGDDEPPLVLGLIQNR